MVAEFQAVVLAYGRSSPLEELISTPKPLLQIGFYPLIYYPLSWLSRNGFDHAFVVVSESMEKEIFQALAPFFENNMTLDFVTRPDDEDYGTADTLRDLHNKNKLKTDLLVLSCDIIADICLQDVANLFRMHDASVTVVYQKALAGDILVPGAKTKKHHDREIIVLDPSSNRLVLSTSEADVEEFLEIPRYLLMRYPRLRVRTALQDAHIYLLKKWVLDYLVSEPRISSIRSELIPKLIKKQHRSKSQLTANHQFTSRQTPNEITNNSKVEQLDRISAEDELELLARNMSMWSDHQGDMAETYFGNSIRCYAYLADSNLCSNLCIRVNTLSAFCEANRLVPRFHQALLPPSGTDPKFSHGAILQGKSQVGADCMIGEGTTVGEKASIKKSIIGRNCTISDKAKISTSVIMDDVVVGENCHIQGSIISNGAVVGEKSELKDCLVGQRYEIPVDSKFTSDTLTDSDRLMEY